MPTCDPKQLAAQIRKGELQNLYYIYGADLVQVRQLTTALIKKATGGNADMALTKFDGQKLELKELEDASRQFSMFAAYNCIQVHDLNADSLREDQMKQLLELLPEIGGATVLIFDITGFDPKDGKKTPQGKNKKLIDCIAKHGTVCEAVQRTPLVLAKELSGLAEKRGCILPLDSAEELVRLCMGNTLILRSELEKLCAYADKGNTITVAMVREVTSPQLETTVFNLARAVVSQRPKAAMEELDKLYAMRTNRTFIVHAIASSFLDLYRASAAMRAGKQPGDMKQDFGYRFDFMVQNAFRDCRRLPPERLRACIRVLRDLEVELNSTSAEERTLLEATIVKMLAIAGG
ncbi:DNA polymerase III subunit delta [uncultured Ruminococcus sp.]|uniref:DNA polymerase III subunit delta n=1 Tax=uncultured Ruminococcus sp. TaxID=165186 RepID=UPI002611AFA2|nr:DNA polymerase III subunit delta [uncultured Ruminococcus sp.]